MSSNLACLNHSGAFRQNHWPTWMNQPLSAFAQTMLEEDEKFYATFPAARWAARIEEHWTYQQASCASQYFEDPGFEHRPDISTYTAASHCYDNYLSDPQVASTSPADGSFPVYNTKAPLNPPNYNCVASIDASASCAFPVEPTQHGWTEQYRNWEATCLIQHYTTSTIFHPAPSMPPTVAQDSSCPIVPSHQPLIDRGLLRPLTVPTIEEQPDRSPSPSTESCLSSPTPTQGSLSPLSSPCRDGLSPAPQQFGSINLTGNWETDAMAVNEAMIHAPVPHAFVPDADSLDVSATSPSTRSLQLTPYRRKTRSNSYPIISANALSHPCSRMRLSTPPNKGRTSTSTQPKAMASKPPLACLYCRARKIACSITEEWAVKKTCNQCDKRGLRCSFPLESYRGVRNKELKVREILGDGDLIPV